MSILEQKTALVTGAAQRIGAVIVETLHQAGWNICLHYRHSQTAAEALAIRLNQQRAESVRLFQADLLEESEVVSLAGQVLTDTGGIDLLVNNASSYFPTALADMRGDTSKNGFETAWRSLMGSNLKAPYLLSVNLAESLAKRQGAIVNIVDIYAERPQKEHSIYCMAKAGLAMMTKTLAVELAPDVRVNGVAPGAILWPENGEQADLQQHILNTTPLARCGTPKDIAENVLHLASSPYVNGQILAVDGGRSVSI